MTHLGTFLSVCAAVRRTSGGTSEQFDRRTSSQVTKYWSRYKLVLVTNVRHWQLIRARELVKQERTHKKKRLREGRRRSGNAISGGVNALNSIGSPLNFSRHGLVITLVKDAWQDIR